MTELTTLVILFKSITLLLGGLITFFAFKAYRRTAARPLRALAVGFAIVTVGSLLAGVLDQLLALDQRYALLAESVLTAIGFTTILYSLYAE